MVSKMAEVILPRGERYSDYSLVLTKFVKRAWCRRPWVTILGGSPGKSQREIEGKEKPPNTLKSPSINF